LTEEISEDFVQKYRDMGLNVGEKIPNSHPNPLKRKAPKPDASGKIPWHNEINSGVVSDKDGLVVFCGKTSNYLGVLDLDNIELYEHFKHYETFTTKSGMRGYHLYFRFLTNPKTLPLTNDKKQHIDFLGQGRVAVLPPSLHPENNQSYLIEKDLPIMYLGPDEQEELFALIRSLGFKMGGNGDGDVDLLPVRELHNPNHKKNVGENRGLDLLRAMDSYKIKNPEFDNQVLAFLAIKYNDDHNVPPLEMRKIDGLVKQATGFGTKINQKEGRDGGDGSVKFDRKDASTVEKAAEIIRNSQHKFITLRQSDEILVYNGKIYSSDDAESLIREACEEIVEHCVKHDRIEVIDKIKARTYTDIEEFDADANLLTVENGILNLDTFDVREHTPEHLSRVLFPCEFIKPPHQIAEEKIFQDIQTNLKDTLFWKFLVRSFTLEGKFREENFQTVLEIMASFFLKKHTDEKNYMLLGGGENGKGVLLLYLEFLVGKDNITHLTLQQIAEDKFMRADLDGKRGNLFTDLENDELKRTGIIKANASDEDVRAQKKYGQPFNLVLDQKLGFSCNRFPKVYDQTQGFFRKWIIIKFQRDFEGDPERDEKLKENLLKNLDERNLVFSCLLHLARKLQRVGKFSHSKDWRTIQKEWNENADPIDDFVTNYTKDSEDNKTKRETYHFYKKVMHSKGERPLGIGQFGKVFAEYFDDLIERDGSKTRRYWCNIGFIEPKQTSLREHDNT